MKGDLNKISELVKYLKVEFRGQQMKRSWGTCVSGDSKNHQLFMIILLFIYIANK